VIDAVIFDKDGTLFDFRQSWSGFARRLVGALADGAEGAGRLAAAIGFDPETGDFAPDSPVIAGTGHEIAAALLPAMPGAALGPLAAQVNRMAVAAEMEPAVPLGPLLGRLRGRGLRLAVATNDVEAAAQAHLAAAGVAREFDLILGADSGHGAKPEPGMLLAVARHLSLAPGRVLMVGDSPHDLIAARAAGMRPVAVLTGVATEPDLAPLAEAVLPDIGALEDWLDGRPAP
jgi:phosphoglycolate phosphatase